MIGINHLIGNTETGITPVMDTTNTGTMTGNVLEAEGEQEIAIHITIRKGNVQEAGRNTGDIILLIEIGGIMIGTIGPARTINLDGLTKTEGVIMAIMSNTTTITLPFIHVTSTPTITENLTVTPITIKIMETRKKENITMAAQEKMTMNVGLNVKPIRTIHRLIGHEVRSNDTKCFAVL